MPGAILPNTGVELPELGGDSGDWDDFNNAAWGNYDVHDHSPGSGVQIPTVGIAIDADLTFNGYGLDDVGNVEFAPVPALAAGSTTLFTSSADNELYWRTAAGVNVKLTSGTTINTSLIGGIGGDYSAVNAQVAFDDANDRYTFKQNNATGWARLASGTVRIYETGTSETVYVGIQTPAALAASYDLTLPIALPASQLLMQLDASGNITASNTLASNANLTLQGTARLLHGTWKKSQAFVPAAVTGGSFTTGVDAATFLSPCILAASSTVYAPVQSLQALDKVTALVIRSALLTGVGLLTLDVGYFRGGLSSFTSLLSGVVTDSSGTTTLTLAATYTYVAGDILWVRASTPAATTYSVYSIETQFEAS